MIAVGYKYYAYGYRGQPSVSSTIVTEKLTVVLMSRSHMPYSAPPLC